MSDFDALYLASKILADRRVLDLRREKEALKLRLFWTEHDLRSLFFALDELTFATTACRCSAVGDACSERIFCNSFSWSEKWTLKLDRHLSTILHLIARCDMEVIALPDEDFSVREVRVEHIKEHRLEQADTCVDQDSHFVVCILNGVLHLWFGNKLHSCTHVGDPELVKLSRFFNLLKGEIDNKYQ